MALCIPHRHHESTILVLPDELLLDIFTKVKTYRPTNKALHPDFASSSSDIAAVRLTCRRFAAASSHLLVHYVRLSGLNLRSLEKLEAISRHPLIRKGVKIIRLELQCYVPALAEDILVFARWAEKRVLELARCHRSSFEHEVESSAYGDCDITEHLVKKRDDLAVLLKGLKAILDAWSSMNVIEWDNGPIHPDTDTENLDWQHQLPEVDSYIESQSFIQLLREAHDLYRRLYEDQEALRKDNTFVARFATALSRMPKAKCVEIQDFIHESSMCLDHRRDGRVVLQGCRDGWESGECADLLDINSLLDPMSWNDIRIHQYHTPPAELLFTLPIALQNAGCEIDSILVRTTTQTEHYFQLLRSSKYNNYAVLGDATYDIGLKSFAFIHSMSTKVHARETPGLEDFEAFQGYIAAMTSSDRLERFRLAIDSDWVSRSFEPESALASSDLMMPKSWRNLDDLHITGLSISLRDLQTLHYMLESNETSLEFLTFSHVRLVSGQWTEALEMLREMDVTDKAVLEPTGAECDSLMNTPPYSEYERIFGVMGGCGNEAGRFINGHGKHNPLKRR